jgi:hypothetical protein
LDRLKYHRLNKIVILIEALLAKDRFKRNQQKIKNKEWYQDLVSKFYFSILFFNFIFQFYFSILFFNFIFQLNSI